MKRLISAMFIVAMLASIPASASAGVGHGNYEHDGFFWRPIVMGYGYKTAWADDAEITRQVHAGDIHFALFLNMGGAVAENLLLYVAASVDIFTVFDAEERRGADSRTMETGTLDIVQFGLGMDYYIMPRNIFLGATLGVANLNIDNPDRIATSSFGFGTELHVGREWWISENWGWGVAGQVSFALVPDQWAGDVFLWKSFGAGVVTTMTYN